MADRAALRGRWWWRGLAAAALVLPPGVAGAQTGPVLTPPRVGFGTVAVGSTSAPQTLTLSSGTVVTVTGVVVPPQFVRTGGTCDPGVDVSPGKDCTVVLAYAPATEGSTQAQLVVQLGASSVSSTVLGTGAPAPATTTTTATSAPPSSPSSTAPAATTPTTRPPATTTAPTTTAPSTSTSTSTSSTVPVDTLPPGSAPPPTVPPPAGEGGPGPSLDAVAAGGRRSGPPGVGLTVTGSGYGAAVRPGGGAVRGALGSRAAVHARPVARAGPGCATVYFILDGRRIGEDRPDAAGDVRRTGLSVPGGTGPGRHAVTSSCRPSGAPALASVAFEVTGTPLHRSAFATALPRVADVDFGAGRLLASAAAVAGLVLLIAFPAELFNATLEEHYDEVRGWFGLRPRSPSAAAGSHHGALLVLFLLLSGPLWFSMQSSSGFDVTTAVGALGLSLATAVVVLAADLPEVAHVRRRYAERASPVVLPGSVLMAVGCVVLSRAVHFQPGYFYGLVGGLALGRSLERDESGRLAARAAGLLLGLSVVSWVALQPVAAAARHTGTGLGPILLENVLGGIFWAALDTLVIALLPLRLLEGAKIVGWSRGVWVVLYGLVLLAFVHILLRPGTGYVSNTTVSPPSLVIGLFVAFATFSFAFWGYFRFRRRLTPEPG